MKLNRIVRRSENDFYGYECEYCHQMVYGAGYDDDNFFQEVIPNVICPCCGLSSKGETEEEQKKARILISLIH